MTSQKSSIKAFGKKTKAPFFDLIQKSFLKEELSTSQK